MTYILINLFTLFSLSSLSVQKIANKNQLALVVIVCEIILVLLATFRSPLMPDYCNYEEAFLFGGYGYERVEPGFKLLIDVVRNQTTSIVFFMFIIAVISISLNIVAIFKMSTSVALSLLFYISNNYLLHDLIQIRCAIAAGIFVLSIQYILNRRPLYYFLLIFIACFFHISSVILFPLYFLKGNNINKTNYLILISLSFILCFIGLKMGALASIIPVPSIQTLWSAYEATQEGANSTMGVNIFNIAFLLRVIVCLAILMKIKEITKYNKYSIIWIKIYCISIASFLLCSDVPVMAFRISELLQSIEFLLFPLIIYITHRKQRIIGKIIAISIAFIFFSLNVFYVKLIV